MNVTVKRVVYQSNVKGLGKELDGRLERIVERAARDGAKAVTALSDPPIDAFARDAESSDGSVTSRVVVGRNDWWAQIFDTGSLGKRRLPLKQPGRREAEWRIRRRGKTYTAHRSREALASGGIGPQYFFIRAKRQAEQQLGVYLQRGI